MDKRRAWKQVVETSQIINTLRGDSEGWKNHPAVRMWRGYTEALIEYYNIFYHYCVNYHHVKAVKLQPIRGSADLIIFPPWLGNEAFHASHRSNLLRKDKEFYSQFGWTEPDDLPYVWPVDKQGVCVL